MKSLKHKLDKIQAGIKAAIYIYKNGDDIKKIDIWYENRKVSLSEDSRYPITYGRLKDQEDDEWYPID